MMTQTFRAFMLTAMMAPSGLLLAQSHFDNGRVTFDVAPGWHTETDPHRPSDVLLKADHGVAFAVVSFRSDLPRTTGALHGVMEGQAIQEASTMFSGISMHVTQSCTETPGGDIGGKNGISCFSQVSDVDGAPAYLFSIAIPMATETGFIVEFAAGDQQDANALHTMDELLQKSLLWGGAGTRPSRQSVAAVPTGEINKTYRSNTNHATFSPPAGWKLVQSDENSFVYVKGDMTYAAYFGDFSGLFYTVGGPKSPWNLHLQGHDHFLADAGNYRMEASGFNNFTQVIVSPASEFEQAQSILISMGSSLKRDPVPQAKAPSYSSGSGSSSSESGSGGCASCGPMVLQFMNNMTGITVGGMQ